MCLSRRRGFTLVELLVVIGIIALLISILLPSLNSANKAARNVACQSNLRQVGLALQQYGNAFRGAIPASWISSQSYTIGTIGGSNQMMHWWQRLQVDGYLPGWNEPGKSAVVCPADSDPFTPFVGFWPDGELHFNASYGINNFMTIHDGAPWSAGGATPDGIDDIPDAITYPRRQPRINNIKNSSEKILVADVAWGYLATPWSPNAPTGYKVFHQWDWLRHKTSKGANDGKANVLWADGHVTGVHQGLDVADVPNDIHSAYFLAGQRQWIADR